MDVLRLTIDRNKLKEARGDLPRSYVAKRIGISAVRLWQIENDKETKPSADVLVRLCAFYEKDISEFTVEAAAA